MTNLKNSSEVNVIHGMPVMGAFTLSFLLPTPTTFSLYSLLGYHVDRKWVRNSCQRHPTIVVIHASHPWQIFGRNTANRNDGIERKGKGGHRDSHGRTQETKDRREP